MQKKEGIDLSVIEKGDSVADQFILDKKIEAWKYPEQDADNDGIKNIDEFKKYKTNTLNSDTDGDGYSDKQEIDSGNDPLKVASLKPVQATELIDCGDNYDCFIEASESCSLAKISVILVTSLSGFEQTLTSYYEITGVERGRCIVYLAPQKIDWNLPPGTHRGAYELANRMLKGRDGICKFIPSDLKSMLSRWKVGAFDSREISCDNNECTVKGGDFGNAECEGPMFTDQF